MRKQGGSKHALRQENPRQLSSFSPSQNCPGWSHEAMPAACLPWEEAEGMKQAWLHLLFWLTIPFPPLAGDPKQQLNSPWWGAWAELYCSSLCDNWFADLSLQHLPSAQNIQPCEKYFHNYDEKGGGESKFLSVFRLSWNSDQEMG